MHPHRLPGIRAGRNCAWRIHVRVAYRTRDLGLSTISIEPGSARPSVSTIAPITTRPWIPARLRRVG